MMFKVKRTEGEKIVRSNELVLRNGTWCLA